MSGSITGVAAPIVGAYLLGSLSFSYLIVRLLKGIDIRTVGSGNAGATNVLRIAGKGPALLALVLDAAKGLSAVLIAKAVGAGPWVVGAVGLAAVVGHLYPVFLGFRGGKGVATAAGTLISLAPIAMLVCLVVFVGLVAWKRYVSLGSVVAAGLCPVTVTVLGLLGGRLDGWGFAGSIGGDWQPLAAATTAIAVLILWGHRENIRRLRAGTEKKIGQGAVAR